MSFNEVKHIEFGLIFVFLKEALYVLDTVFSYSLVIYASIIHSVETVYPSKLIHTIDKVRITII